jgi:hypothetical protein
MQTYKRMLMAALVIAVGIVGVTSAGAQDRSGEAAGPEIDVSADRLLRAASEYLGKAGEFSFHAEITYDSILKDGQMIQFGASSDVWVRRPDRLHVESRGDEVQRAIIFDGRKFALHDLALNVYAVTQAPGELGAALDHFFDQYGFSVPIADLVYPDLYEVFTEYVESGFMVGCHMVDGTPCHHLAFSQESIDWQIWIEDGPRPVPRKLLITHKSEDGSPQYSARLTHWDFRPDVEGQ